MRITAARTRCATRLLQASKLRGIGRFSTGVGDAHKQQTQNLDSFHTPNAYGENWFYDQTRLPVQHATTIDPGVYKDPEAFRLERKRVWEASWACVGVTSQVARHGDVIVRKVGSQEVIITRAKDGQIRAFQNVCRHRGARLVLKDGRYSVLCCKYHRWGYALDGRLMATPLFSTKEEEEKCSSVAASFEQNSFDKRDYPLLPVRLDTFGHLIFVNLDDHAPPLLEYLGKSTADGGLPGQLSEYLPLLEDSERGIVSARKGQFKIAANWKLLVENFIEYYHLPSVHPSLCDTSAIDNHHRAQSSGNHITFVTRPLTSGGIPLDPHYLPHFHKLGKENNETAWFFAIFPNIFCWLLPHSVFTLIVSPDYDAIEKAGDGSQLQDLIGRSIEHVDLSVSREALSQPDAEEKIQQMWDYYVQLNDEDVEICEDVQKGISAQSYKGGRFSFRFEEAVYRFQNIYIDHMVGERRIMPGDDVI